MQYQFHRGSVFTFPISPLLVPYPISPVVSPAHSLTVEHTPPEAETVKPRKAHAPQHPTGALTIGRHYVASRLWAQSNVWVNFDEELFQFYGMWSCPVIRVGSFLYLGTVKEI